MRQKFSTIDRRMPSAHNSQDVLEPTDATMCKAATTCCNELVPEIRRITVTVARARLLSRMTSRGIAGVKRRGLKPSSFVRRAAPATSRETSAQDALRLLSSVQAPLGLFALFFV